MFVVAGRAAEERLLHTYDCLHIITDLVYPLLCIFKVHPFFLHHLHETGVWQAHMAAID